MKNGKWWAEFDFIDGILIGMAYLVLLGFLGWLN